MKKLYSFLAVVCLSLAAACSTIDNVGPNEQIGAAVAAVTTARSTTDTLLVAKKISKADAQNLNDQADAIVALLQTLSTLPPSTDTTTKLNQALALLTALQGYLASKGT